MNFLKLRYALDAHLNFRVWKNHWNTTARFWVIKDFSLSNKLNNNTGTELGESLATFII